MSDELPDSILVKLHRGTVCLTLFRFTAGPHKGEIGLSVDVESEPDEGEQEGNVATITIREDDMPDLVAAFMRMANPMREQPVPAPTPGSPSN